jgi:uncharacterized protein YjiS (DUF1127 family)
MTYPAIRTTPAPGLAALAAALYRRWRARQEARRTRHVLHGLSDASLRDIGLRRHQLDPVAPEFRWPL